jgi:DNA polymerase I-like protein with 3'-5' exonuclease and polymerase domains
MLRMKPLFFDSETTAKPLHDPFNPRAKLVYVGCYDGTTYTDYAIEYLPDPYGEKLNHIQGRINEADILVGANPKFDLHWFRRYGLEFAGKLVWDVLLVQFILNHQTTPFTSLNAVLTQHGLPLKLDVVKLEYWDKGLDTMAVPEEILKEYQKGDVIPLKAVYERQLAEVLSRGLLPLIRVQMLDLLMLEEMEWNGNKYAVAGSRHEAAVQLQQVRKTKHELCSYTPIKPRKWSTDFLSLLLYGGTYKYVEKEAYLFTYKDGSTKDKIHNVAKEVVLPRLTEPPKKARAKEGFWSTDEDTLKKLKTTGVAKKIVKCLLVMREKEKLVGTYLKGFPKKIELSEWEHSLIHTNYNQGVAVTGRLSSDKPNCQNNPPEQKPYFISRYT